ncbi:DUF302 domain-containing protein [Pseudonocardia xinjiangensis]|uniref:DUF302 domain-containing protein n=1 Tax=Pseudonocardia xinjiangensis TaxID=75289 RepID=A0ABX1RAU4_9PSEU|nr:DUF302 domain-containing protein [Pseudonocardia xinjiangensis]NMH76328.1 DUF302 domain-containing protein [Pseudonocardia xinjiangensis]
MSVLVRAHPTRRSDTIRTWGAAMTLAVVAAACGNPGNGEVELEPHTAPGQPPGTILLAAGTDFAGTVQRVQGAITGGGGAVATVVDHTASAREAGATIPASALVIGGSPAGQWPLLRIDQRAGAELPQRYLVRQAADGSVSLTVDSADYVAAVSGIGDLAARDALQSSTAGVLTAAVPGARIPVGSPLVGVTPSGHLVTVYGSLDVPATVERLRREADRSPTRSLAVVDLAAGSATPGPPIRPTSVVFVGNPAAEAPLLAAAPSIGLDLPLRFVVWVDEQNLTQIGYPDVARLAARHGVAADNPNVVRMAADSDRLARLAAGLIE